MPGKKGLFGERRTQPVKSQRVVERPIQPHVSVPPPGSGSGLSNEPAGSARISLPEASFSPPQIREDYRAVPRAVVHHGLSRDRFREGLESFWESKIQNESAYTSQFKSILQNIFARLESHLYSNVPDDQAQVDENPEEDTTSTQPPSNTPFDIETFCEKSASTIAQIWNDLGGSLMDSDDVSNLAGHLLGFFNSAPEPVVEQDDLDRHTYTTPERENDGGAIASRPHISNQTNITTRSARTFAP